MTIEVVLLMFATGTVPYEASPIEAWLENLPACAHETAKKSHTDQTRPSTPELIEALERTTMKPIHVLRVIEQLSARHAAKHEAADVIGVLRRIAEDAQEINVRFAHGEEVDRKESAAYEAWFRDRARKAAIDALASHDRALTDVILASWAAGKDRVLAPRAERALSSGGRQ